VLDSRRETISALEELSLTDNKSIIRRARMAITENSRVRAIQNRHAREKAEEYHRELLLFLDDCKTHGLDWENPEQRPVIVRAWLAKLGYQVDEDDSDDVELEAMVADHHRMTF
jgi:hypothetical protein